METMFHLKETANPANEPGEDPKAPDSSFPFINLFGYFTIYMIKRI
jgi:hypothetical protein